MTGLTPQGPAPPASRGPYVRADRAGDPRHHCPGLDPPGVPHPSRRGMTPAPLHRHPGRVVGKEGGLRGGGVWTDGNGRGRSSSLAASPTVSVSSHTAATTRGYPGLPLCLRAPCGRSPDTSVGAGRSLVGAQPVPGEGSVPPQWDTGHPRNLHHQPPVHASQ